MTSHNIMAIGSSGRVVIELETELKQALHEALRQNGLNLKEWFVDRALQFLEEQEDQMPLSLEGKAEDSGDRAE